MTQSRSEPLEPKLIRIPAGRYQIGIDDAQVRNLAPRSSEAQRWQQKGYFSREQPAHFVQLKGFEIARYPVTAAEYRRFVSDAGYSHPDYWGHAGQQWLRQSGREHPAFWNDPDWPAGAHLPLVGVSWYESLAYCRWLAARTGRPYRLPSEAEWEAAARGPDGLLYPWGDVFEGSNCNCRGHGPGRRLAPGTMSPAGDSPFGVVDMAGNVSEWTLSQFRSYPIRLADGRDDHNATGVRVIRGGSWHSPPIRVRATARGYNDPDFCDHDVGFRLAAGDC